MKTAISVADDLIAEADRTARDLGVSRSRVISLALESYLRERRHEAMLEQLNRVYAGEPDPAERRTTARMKAKFRTAIRERW